MSYIRYSYNPDQSGFTQSHGGDHPAWRPKAFPADPDLSRPRHRVTLVQLGSYVLPGMFWQLWLMCKSSLCNLSCILRWLSQDSKVTLNSNGVLMETQSQQGQMDLSPSSFRKQAFHGARPAGSRPASHLPHPASQRENTPTVVCSVLYSHPLAVFRNCVVIHMRRWSAINRYL